MIKDFTSEHLVSFLYNETSNAETRGIKAALQNDSTLKSEYNEMREGYLMLPKAQFRPSGAALRNILNYSKESVVLA